MSSAEVVLRRQGDPARLQFIARVTGARIVDQPETEALVLEDGEEGLSLVHDRDRQHMAVRVDFVRGKARWRMGQGELIARAVGVPRHLPLTVVDATAGLGRDAFVLASKGCKVYMLERHPVIWSLLSDGLERARTCPEVANTIGRMTLVRTDAVDWLQSAGEGIAVDVVYLDPMYPEKRRGGAVKKEMQILHALVERDEHEADLLAAAHHCARFRVVVKRPRRAAPLVGAWQPDFSITGKTTRFDVYRGAG